MLTTLTGGPSDPATTPSDQVIRNGSIGGASGVLRLLDQLSTESHHPELQTCPLFFWGHSAAGNFGFSFAALHPDRTLGVVFYHSNMRGARVDVKTTGSVPVLLLAGEKDTVSGIEDAHRLWELGRAAGAPWAFAIQPGEPHESAEGFKKANLLMLPWAAEVIRQRVSKSQLRAINEHSSWLGNNVSGDILQSAAFHGETVNMSWLPDEASAKAWKALSGGTTNRVPLLVPKKSLAQKQVTVSRQVLSQYTGIYQLSPDADLVLVVNGRRTRIAGKNPLAPHFNILISLDEEQLVWQIPGERLLSLIPDSDSHFSAKTVDTEMDFTRDDRGSVTHLVLTHRDVLGHESKLVAQRLPEREAARILPTTLEDYVGAYELQPGIKLVITVEDGQLMAEPDSGFKEPFFPLSETAFGSRLVNAEIRFIKNVVGTPTSLILHQGGVDTEARRLP
jgi:hypothetical protein